MARFEDVRPSAEADERVGEGMWLCAHKSGDGLWLLRIEEDDPLRVIVGLNSDALALRNRGEPMGEDG